MASNSSSATDRDGQANRQRYPAALDRHQRRDHQHSGDGNGERQQPADDPITDRPPRHRPEERHTAQNGQQPWTDRRTDHPPAQPRTTQSRLAGGELPGQRHRPTSQQQHRHHQQQHQHWVTHTHSSDPRKHLQHPTGRPAKQRHPQREPGPPTTRPSAHPADPTDTPASHTHRSSAPPLPTRPDAPPTQTAAPTPTPAATRPRSPASPAGCDPHRGRIRPMIHMMTAAAAKTANVYIAWAGM
jgi:hypothetical protein